MRLPAEGAAEVELAAGLPGFLDAIDVVSEWLDREDPDRSRGRPVVIVATCPEGEEQVWAYPAPSAQDRRELVRIFGFDPTSRRSRGGGFERRSWTARLAGAERRPLPELDLPTTAPTAAPTPAAPGRPRLAVPRLAAVPSPARLAEAVRAAWQDPASRGLLVVAVAGAWLSLAFLQPVLLLLPASAVAALRWRRRRRATIPEPEDWF